MYVIINGVSSETLSGVQVLELPPITKPRMRRNVDVIDGRAGDIVTKLGYEAYDKTIRILLHDNYNLDQVVSFFNSKGEIIFSNDSFIYQFEVLDEIDFERAVKFKTAEITFHVQPYKKSPAQTPKVFTSSGYVTNMGNVLSAPTFDIVGSGTVTLLIDSITMLSIDMTDGQIIIDSDAQDAYLNGNLKNRRVTGSYENLRLTPGRHLISWTGTVTSLTISEYSRWI